MPDRLCSASRGNDVDPQWLVESDAVEEGRASVGACKECEVAVSTGHDGYPSAPPYSPSIAYPEYPFDSETLAKEANFAYEGVRNALHLLQLDQGHYGRRDWNPLGQFIRPGDTVVLKPNLVRDFRETLPGHGNCMMAHGSIIRAVADYVHIALKGKGRIVVADAPQQGADFDAIRRIAGLDQIQDLYHCHGSLDVEVYDLRPEVARTENDLIVGYDPLPGDPRGYVNVDLGSRSMFAPIEHLCDRVYGSTYDTAETQRHHTGGVHEYMISRTILEADCIINLPKLKTHKKAGLTVCLKNMVGINGKKNWLPHYRSGTPAQGGDQYADDGLKRKAEQHLMACFRRLSPWLRPVWALTAKPIKAIGHRVFGDTNVDTVRSGNWCGNDTVWRTIIDLNRIVRYANVDGNIQGSPARRMLCLVDGIIGGEGNGPIDPRPKAAGMVVAGANPVAVEHVCACIMGFDHTRLPLLCHALNDGRLGRLAEFTYDEIICKSEADPPGRPLKYCTGLNVSFKPHFGWQGKVEVRRSDMATV